MLKKSIMVFLLFATVVVAEEIELTDSEKAMDLMKKTMIANSVEEREKMIEEIKSLDLSKQELDQVMRLVRGTKQNFKIHLEHGVKLKKANKLCKLANGANSWEERRGYIREIIALNLLPQYQEMCAMILKSGERLFRKRMERLKKPEKVVVSDPAPETKPSEGEIKATSVDISVNRFVMIGHGWNSGPGTLENPNWPLKMGLAYAHVIDDSQKMSDFEKEAIGYSLKFDDVEIVVIDWSVISKGFGANPNVIFPFIKSPDAVFWAGRRQGYLWGQVYQRKWKRENLGGPSKIHLIGHSNGCIFIDSVCRVIAKPGRTIQMTLLDANLPKDATDEERNMGEMAHFAEHFLHRSLVSVADSDLPSAYNMNIILFKGRGDGFSGHSFTHRWYYEILKSKDRLFLPGPVHNVVLGKMPRHLPGEYPRGASYLIYR